MSRTKVILGTTALVVVAAAALAGLWWRTSGQEYLNSLREKGQVSSEEGRRFGLHVNYRGCLERATSSAEACVFCEVNARVFLAGCMQTAKDVDVFCASLPSYDDRLARLGRAVEACGELKRSGERCARVVNDAAVFCEKRKLAMPTQAGNFFPPEYKRFPFKEGDLLVSRRSDVQFSVKKILKVDRFDFRKGESINIQGKAFVATEDDYLLVVSAAYGEAEFSSFEEARIAATVGKWTVKLGHAPNRTPGAAEGQTRVGYAPVVEAELVGYRQWRQAFEKGQAGVF
jgi:hypothetical protein